MNLIALYLRLLVRWLRFYRRALTVFDIHAPFLYDFAETIVEDRRMFYAFSDIEVLRGTMQQDHRRINITDLGAGSLVSSSPSRTVADLARYSAVRPALGRTLFRIVHHYRPDQMLELGASLGISALYQAWACRNCRLIAVEGCPAIAGEAKRNLERMRMENVQLINASFQEFLPVLLAEAVPLDYLYLDGDHREGASLEYFETCLRLSHNDSVFVIADIHWSTAMQRAWGQMRQHPQVTLSVDLFHCGVLFFRKEIRVKQHVSLVPARWKPWRMGFGAGKQKNPKR